MRLLIHLLCIVLRVYIIFHCSLPLLFVLSALNKEEALYVLVFTINTCMRILQVCLLLVTFLPFSVSSSAHMSCSCMKLLLTRTCTYKSLHLFPLSLSLSLSSFCPLSLSFSFQTGLVSSFLDNSKDIEGEQTAISIAAGDIAAIGLSLVSTCAILYT